MGKTANTEILLLTSEVGLKALRALHDDNYKVHAVFKGAQVSPGVRVLGDG